MAKGPDGVRPGELRDGKKHGLWIENDGFPLTLFERTYRDGVPHGLEREWSMRALVRECELVDGKKHGVQRSFYRAGTVENEVTYVHGTAQGACKTFAPDGTLSAEVSLVDGDFYDGMFESRSSDTGEIFARGRYERGVQVGPWVYLMGDEKYRGTFVDGKRHGLFELIDETGTWTGSYEMDRHVGTWELRRDDLSASGAMPDGERVTWQVSGRTWHGTPATFSIDVTSREELARWLPYIEAWLAAEYFDTKDWPDDEDARTEAWATAALAAFPDPDPTTMSADEQRRRDELFAARGPVIATVGFPREVMAASAELTRQPTTLTFEPGEYEILEDNEDALAIRRTGVRAETWEYLDESSDYDYVLLAARDDLEELEYPESVTRALAIEPELVWLTNPAGNPLRLFLGRARSGNVVAVYAQFWWSHTRRRD
jgi:antitoxin component YwqK of YwqJK toxin-antitoxin module